MNFNKGQLSPSTPGALSLGLKLPIVPPPQAASPNTTTKRCSYEGVTYEFIKDPPQKFICTICTQLVKDPHLTACCGHEFCDSCLKKWEKQSATNCCPHCRQKQFVHILDKQTQREINELEVNCLKRRDGCEWKGGLGVIQQHVKDCSYAAMKCEDCSLFVLRKDFLKHTTSSCPYRESKCVYCDRRDAYFKVISFVHLAECPGYPMDCPNKCGTTGIKRAELSEHRESCSLEEVECPLKSAGCLEKLLRKDLQEHVTTNQPDHLLKLMVAFKKSQCDLQAQTRKLKELQMFQVTTSEAMKRISNNVDQFLGKSLTTELGPLRSIRALLGSRAIVLDSEHKEISLLCPNFSKIEKKILSWESLPFYIDPGYKLCLVLSPGHGKSNEISAELRLLPGEFDSELTWPCNIKLSRLYLSLKKMECVTDSKTVSSLPLQTTKELTPFSLAVKGSVHKCVYPTAINQVLWHTDKLMDALPPFPSAIRAQYLHNDCLTVKLSLIPPQETTMFLEKHIPKLTLQSSSGPFSGCSVSVSTTTGIGHSTPSRRRVGRRRK